MADTEEMTLLEIMEIDGAEKTLALMELGTNIVTSSLEAVDKAKEAMGNLVSFASSITEKEKNNDMEKLEKLLSRLEKVKKLDTEEKDKLEEANSLLKKEILSYKKQIEKLEENKKDLIKRKQELESKLTLVNDASEIRDNEISELKSWLNDCRDHLINNGGYHGTAIWESIIADRRSKKIGSYDNNPFRIRF